MILLILILAFTHLVIIHITDDCQESHFIFSFLIMKQKVLIMR